MGVRPIAAGCTLGYLAYQGSEMMEKGELLAPQLDYGDRKGADTAVVHAVSRNAFNSTCRDMF